MNKTKLDAYFSQWSHWTHESSSTSPMRFPRYSGTIYHVYTIQDCYTSTKTQGTEAKIKIVLMGCVSVFLNAKNPSTEQQKFVNDIVEKIINKQQNNKSS